MLKKPQIGYYYDFYPNCIKDYNNLYKAYVQQIISFKDSKKELIYDCMYDYKLNEHEPDVRTLYNIWQDMCNHDDFKDVYKPECFLKLSVNEYDRFYSYATKNNKGQWITFNINHPYQRGELVVD